MSEDVGGVMSGLLDEVSGVKTTINEQLPHIKKYYSYIGSEGNQARQEALVDRYVDEAVVKQAIGIDPDSVYEILGEFSPKLGDLLKKNPSLITKAMPKIQQYIDMRNDTAETGEKPAAQTAENVDDLSWVHQGNLG